MAGGSLDKILKRELREEYKSLGYGNAALWRKLQSKRISERPKSKRNWTQVQIEFLAGLEKLLNCLRGINRDLQDNPRPARR